jgi:hypothetical protein
MAACVVLSQSRFGLSEMPVRRRAGRHTAARGFTRKGVRYFLAFFFDLLKPTPPARFAGATQP